MEGHQGTEKKKQGREKVYKRSLHTPKDGQHKPSPMRYTKKRCENDTGRLPCQHYSVLHRTGCSEILNIMEGSMKIWKI
jgi:hypothetical protein